MAGSETLPASSAVDPPLLENIGQRVPWLSTYLIQYANRVRPNPDSIKVGGHQASCASVVSLLTADYFAAAEADDLIAIKPHASPVYHAIQYLLGNRARCRSGAACLERARWRWAWTNTGSPRPVRSSTIMTRSG